MRINNLKINGFGKLENKEIKLSNNINLIYGENETGKTTLLKFIPGIFYGISKNKNKKEFSDFERYKPWQEIEFSGKIEYTLDDKNKFEVFRDFNKKNPKIYKNAEDISNKFNINKTNGNEFFYEQTKIDEQTFLSTTLIEQKQVVLNGDEQNILIQKIANLLSSGTEKISYKKTIETLSKRQVEEVGTLRTVGRPLNVINEKIENLMKDKENIEQEDEKKDELQKRQENIKMQIKEKEIKIDLIKKIKQNKYEGNIENEKIKINNEIINDEKIKINNLKNKINNLKNEKNQKNNLINLSIFIILFLINLLLFIFKVNNLIKIIAIFTTLAITAIIIIKKIKLKTQRETEKNKILLEIKSLENNIEKILNNINKINSEKIEKNNFKINSIKNEFENKIDIDEINYLIDENILDIKNILENLEKEVANLKLQLYTNEIDYNNAIKKSEERAKIDEELQIALENKEELLKLERKINLAKTALENAYEKMKTEITPKFTKNLSNIVNKISNGKYNKIKYIDSQGLIVELENGEYINANKLSMGTIDQLYLSLRISAMQEITKEKMPIILDETFAYYDDKRLENIFTYIDRELKQHQIIIFACSNREKEILDKNNIEYNYIKL